MPTGKGFRDARLLRAGVEYPLVLASFAGRVTCEYRVSFVHTYLPHPLHGRARCGLYGCLALHSHHAHVSFSLSNHPELRIARNMPRQQPSYRIVERVEVAKAALNHREHPLLVVHSEAVRLRRVKRIE